MTKTVVFIAQSFEPAVDYYYFFDETKHVNELATFILSHRTDELNTKINLDISVMDKESADKLKSRLPTERKDKKTGDSIFSTREKILVP